MALSSLRIALAETPVAADLKSCWWCGVKGGQHVSFLFSLETSLIWMRVERQDKGRDSASVSEEAP